MGSQRSEDHWATTRDDPQVDDPVLVSLHNAESAADCPAVGPLGYLCTRNTGHDGRHMGGIHGGAVVAAWPGGHRPTVADMGSVQVTDVMAAAGLAAWFKTPTSGRPLGGGWEPQEIDGMRDAITAALAAAQEGGVR